MSFFTATTREDWENLIERHLNEELPRARESKSIIVAAKMPSEGKGVLDNGDDSFQYHVEEVDDYGEESNDDDGEYDEIDAGFDSPSKNKMRHGNSDIKSRKRHLSAKSDDLQFPKKKLTFDGEASAQKVVGKKLAGRWSPPEAPDVNRVIEEGTELTRRLRRCVDILGEETLSMFVYPPACQFCLVQASLSVSHS